MSQQFLVTHHLTGNAQHCLIRPLPMDPVFVPFIRTKCHQDTDDDGHDLHQDFLEAIGTRHVATSLNYRLQFTKMNRSNQFATLWLHFPQLFRQNPTNSNPFKASE
jgi:hypothetical protein